jgi:YcxB-like protein
MNSVLRCYNPLAVQINYQLTSDDFYQGCLAWRNRRMWQLWLRWFAYVIVAIASLFSLLILLVARNPGTTQIALFGIIFGIGWFAYMLLAPRFSSRRQFRNNPMAQSPINLEVSDQGFEFHNDHADSKVAWSAYIAWGEVRSVFVIMPQPRAYIAIPKRAFTDEQLTEFRDMLRRNIGKK